MAAEDKIRAERQRRRRIELPSLEEHIYELIKEDILTGVLRPGSPLVEARLAEEFGISKTPVREALIRLRLDGLVKIERFRGARVAEPSADDVREICVLRRWIEGGIAESLAENPDPAVLAALRGNIEEARRALDAGDDRRYLDEIREFDHILARASHNSWVERALSELYNIFGLIGVVSLEVPNRRGRSIDEHGRIYEAIAAGDADAARKATASHIGSIEQDYLHAVASLAKAAADGRKTQAN